VPRLDLVVSVPEHALDTAGFDPLHGARVSWAEDRLTVLAGTAPRTAALPDSAARDSLARWLAPDPWIESDDSAIVAVSREVAGRAGDPAARARRLTAWTDRRLRDAPADPAGARAILASRQGDADAHALVLTALARAAGIPARPVAGLLLVGNRFYLHSWCELYLDGLVEVDPMLGQFPVDARHLRVATDGRARLDVLLPLIGGLRLWTTPASGTP
jgi:transglutaminase-like putative cysteine protease